MNPNIKAFFILFTKFIENLCKIDNFWTMKVYMKYSQYIILIIMFIYHFLILILKCIAKKS